MGCTFVLKYWKSRDDDDEAGCWASNATIGTNAIIGIEAVLLLNQLFRAFVIYHGWHRPHRILSHFSIGADRVRCMKKQLLLTLILAAIVATPAFAQLASPNAAGVAAGHIHLNANDVEVQKKFWTDVGGTVINREKLVMVQFPGIYVLLRKQDYNGGSVGSVINHFGLYVKDFDKAVARWKAAGLNWEPGNNPGQGYLNGPDSVRIEI